MRQLVSNMRYPTVTALNAESQGSMPRTPHLIEGELMAASSGSIKPDQQLLYSHVNLTFKQSNIRAEG